MDDSLRADEESADKWRRELLRQIAAGRNPEHGRPFIVWKAVLHPQQCNKQYQSQTLDTEEETFVVRKEHCMVDYFVYRDPAWLGELLLDFAVATALIWGVTSCILSVL